MKPHRLFSLVFLLSACTQAAQDGQQFANSATSDAQQVGEKVKEMFTYYPPQSDKKLPVPQRYCYKVWQDVMCYQDARAGASDRLVAYQGNKEVWPEKVIEAGDFSNWKPKGTPLPTKDNPMPDGSPQAEAAADARDLTDNAPLETASTSAAASASSAATPMRVSPSFSATPSFSSMTPSFSVPTSDAASAVPTNAPFAVAKPLNSVSVGAPPAVAGSQ